MKEIPITTENKLNIDRFCRVMSEILSNMADAKISVTFKEKEKAV